MCIWLKIKLFKTTDWCKLKSEFFSYLLFPPSLSYSNNNVNFVNFFERL